MRRLLGEDDVLGNRHHRDQHEVLVHHADPRSIAALGEEMRTGSPLMRISPSSGWYSP